MAEDLCMFKPCNELAMYSCSCQEPAYLVCGSHFGYHMKKGISTNHRIEPIYNELTDMEIEKLRYSEFKLLHIRLQALDHIVLDCSEKIREARKVYEEKRKDIMDKIGPILNRIRISILRKLNKRSEIDNLMTQLCETFELEQLNTDRYLHGILLNTIKENGGFEEAISATLNKKFKTELLDSKGFSAVKNSSIIQKIDHYLGTIENITFNDLPVKFGDNAGICEIGNGELFYCGGFNTSAMNTCYKLNINTNTCQQLSNIPSPASCFAPIIVNNMAYIFGGYANYPPFGIKQGYRCNLSNGGWQAFNLPVNCYNVFSVDVGTIRLYLLDFEPTGYMNTT